MTTRTTIEQREAFIQRHAQGESYAEISRAYGVSWQCVRYWWHRFRRGEGVKSQYQREHHQLLMRFSPLVRYAILHLKLTHPHWGPQRLRYQLQRRPTLVGQRIPSVTQIGRYVHQWVCFRRPVKRSRLPSPPITRPTHVHQCWQVDFKLGIALADGTQVNLHTVHDPVGEVCIAANATPAGAVGRQAQRVRLEELQTTLRLGFCQWGTLPEEIQTDNEALFTGNPTERFPSRFALWLIGLGIHHHTIRPSKPTDNAEVERNHRTIMDYVISDEALASYPSFQRHLAQAWHDLAFDLPSYAACCAGKPPVVAHPDLLQPPHPYQPGQECALFDLQRVDHFLAQFTWQRRVAASGQISLGGQHHYYSVGRTYAQQLVWIHFDPADRHFVFFADASATQCLARRQARHLSVVDLTGLSPQPVQLSLPLIFPKD